MNDDRTSKGNGAAEQKVGMGELCVWRGAGRLKTLLGSCIGLVLHDDQQRVGGLAHIVLPRATNQDGPPGKYADTAISELIRQIEQLGGRSKRLVAKYAGGANMFDSSSANNIGDINIEAVAALLQSLGIPVLGTDCRGKQGRRMCYDVQTGQVTVERVGSPAIEL